MVVKLILINIYIFSELTLPYFLHVTTTKEEEHHPIQTLYHVAERMIGSPNTTTNYASNHTKQEDNDDEKRNNDQHRKPNAFQSSTFYI